MTAVKQMKQSMSLAKSLFYCGLSKFSWYYTKTPRNIPLNKDVTKTVQKIGTKRPTYGTRRMAAAASRELGLAVNRKQIRRIFHRLAWITPSKTKKDIIKVSRKLFHPSAPNQLWEADMSYVDCGSDGWCYCFNVIDAFTRKWVGYSFSPSATSDIAIQSIVYAVASNKPDCNSLRIRTDNGTQYKSHATRNSIKLLGIQHEFIWHHTPQQNGHVESFHKTLKKEYLWPHEFTNFSEAEVILADAFADYNYSRIHSSLGYLTPVEFVQQWEMRNK